MSTHQDIDGDSGRIVSGQPRGTAPRLIGRRIIPLNRMSTRGGEKLLASTVSDEPNEAPGDLSDPELFLDSPERSPQSSAPPEPRAAAPADIVQAAKPSGLSAPVDSLEDRLSNIVASVRHLTTSISRAPHAAGIEQRQDLIDLRADEIETQLLRVVSVMEEDKKSIAESKQSIARVSTSSALLQLDVTLLRAKVLLLQLDKTYLEGRLNLLEEARGPSGAKRRRID
ncbi:hypothetical protein ACJ41O_013049 [Fusarium nematophilum]